MSERTLTLQESRNQRKENFGRIMSALKTYMPEFEADSSHGVGVQVGLEQEVGSVFNTDIREDFARVSEAITHDFDRYQAGVMLGELLGRAHNIGSVYPVEETR